MSAEEVGRITISTQLDTKELESSLSSLKKTAVIGLTAALTAASAALIKFGKDAINAASDLSEVQNVVDTTFGEDGTKKIEEWAKSADSAFGLSELAAKKYNGTMGAMLKSMGLSSDAVLQMSTDMTGLAGDFASFYNLDHEDAFNKIRSGISGETEPLKQLGINMSVANLEAFALSQGIATAYNSMTQAEQATLRYNYLMSVTADAQGDFAKTAETSLANSLRILSLEFESLSATIGKDMLPATLSGTQALTDMVQGLAEIYSDEGFDGLAKGIGDMIATIISAASEYLPEFIDLGIDIIEALILGIAQNTPEILASIAVMFLKLVGVSVEHATYWIASLVEMLLEGGYELVESLWGGITNAYDWFMTNISEFVIDTALVFGEGVDLLIKQGGDFVEGLWDGIEGGYEWIVKKIDAWVDDLISWVSDGYNDMKDAGTNLVEGVWQGISGSVSWIKNKIRSWVGDVTSYIKRLFGINSPSKVMEDLIGVNLVKGIGVGFDKEMPELRKDFASQLGWLTDYAANVDVGLSSRGVSLKEKLNLSLSSANAQSTHRVILEVDGMTLTEIVNKYNNKLSLAYGG